MKFKIKPFSRRIIAPKAEALIVDTSQRGTCPSDCGAYRASPADHLYARADVTLERSQNNISECVLRASPEPRCREDFSIDRSDRSPADNRYPSFSSLVLHFELCAVRLVNFILQSRYILQILRRNRTAFSLENLP